ncbi:hypothetical protein YPPY03_3614, partial [Yersinia pestis PY-03]
MLYKNFQFHPN